MKNNKYNNKQITISYHVCTETCPVSFLNLDFQGVHHYPDNGALVISPYD